MTRTGALTPRSRRPTLAALSAAARRPATYPPLPVPGGPQKRAGIVSRGPPAVLGGGEAAGEGRVGWCTAVQRTSSAGRVERGLSELRHRVAFVGARNVGAQPSTAAVEAVEAVARASASVANQGVLLTAEDVDTIVGPAADGRDFIQRTFDGLYFTADARAFLDSAWSP